MRLARGNQPLLPPPRLTRPPLSWVSQAGYLMSDPERYTVEITRPRNWVDALASYAIVVDGIVVDRIREGGTVAVELEPGLHELHLQTQRFWRSPSITLDEPPGSRLRLICHPTAHRRTALGMALFGRHNWIALRLDQSGTRHVAVVERDESVIVMAYSARQDGMWFMNGWFRILNGEVDRRQLGTAVREALVRYGGAAEMDLGGAMYPISPVLDALGLVTPGDFGRGSRQVTIYEDETQTEVQATRNTGSDFAELPEQGLILPPRADADALGDAVRHALELSQ
jgi:hypothetical protein